MGVISQSFGSQGDPTPIEPLKNDQDMVESIPSPFSERPTQPKKAKIFPSIKGLLDLTPINDTVFNIDEIDKYDIPFTLATQIRGVFENTIRIQNDSCKIKTFYEIVRIICTYSHKVSGCFVLAQDIALRTLCGSEKSQALAEIARAMVREGEYDRLNSVAEEILKCDDHPIETFTSIVNTISKKDKDGATLLLDLAQKIEPPAFKILLMIEAAINLANTGHSETAEQILNYVRREFLPTLNPIPQEIYSKLTDVSACIVYVQTQGLGERYSQIYNCLLKQIEISGKLPELPPEEQSKIGGWSTLIDLAGRAIKAQRFDNVLKIAEAIQNDAFIQESVKKFIIKTIARSLASLSFKDKPDYIAKLLSFVDFDPLEIDDYLFSIVLACDELDKYDLALAFAQKLLKDAPFDRFLTKLIMAAQDGGKFDRAAWLLQQLDGSYCELKQKLILLIAGVLNKEGSAAELTKKLYANSSAPMEDVLETFIQMLVVEIKEQLRRDHISWAIPKQVEELGFSRCRTGQV